MSEQVPSGDQGSVYAQEGTAAHALAEMMARQQIIGGVTLAAHNKKLVKWRKEFDIADDAEAEMVDHGQAYVDYLKARLEEHTGAQLLLEQRLPTGVPDSWGTSDAIIVSPAYLESVDYKYGLGVRVFASGNPQLRLYGVGALDTYGDLLGEVKDVRLTVFQPRLDWLDFEELPATELRAWRDDYVIPRAALALTPDAPFGPSEEACRWCPASGQCKAQMEWATARDFGLQPDFMDEHELADALSQIPGIRAWCNAVDDYCLNRVYSEGKPIPGFKVVMSGGKRSFSDPEGAVEALVMLGFPEEAVSRRTPKTIGDLEKLLKRGFSVLNPFIKKGEGSPSLVPESDSREAINPEGQAAADFAKEDS